MTETPPGSFFKEISEVTKKQFDPISLKNIIRNAANQGKTSVQATIGTREMFYLHDEGFVTRQLQGDIYMISWGQIAPNPSSSGPPVGSR